VTPNNDRTPLRPQVSVACLRAFLSNFASPVAPALKPIYHYTRITEVVPDHRGRSVSTGWLRWRWHAEDARKASLNFEQNITANNDVAGRVGFQAAPLRMAA